jgi:hypothetical protein
MEYRFKNIGVINEELKKQLSVLQEHSENISASINAMSSAAQPSLVCSIR